MGLQVANLEDATKNADVVMLLLPDQIMADVYNDQIASHIKEGATLLFAHGFNIHLKLYQEKIYQLQWLLQRDLDIF